MLNVAIIGLGTISFIHKEAIEKSKLAKIVAVCDIDESKKSIYGGINFYTDVEVMFTKQNIDCVHICLPHYLHLPIILKCAEHGINIFTEKPLVLNYEEATRTFDIEKKYNIKIGVCLQNRYNTTSIEIKSILQSGKYGKFLGSKGIVTWSRTIDYYNAAPWRGIMALAGGGVMMNQSIHTLDLLSYITCKYFESVKAKVANFTLEQTEIEDTVMAHFKYKNSDATSMYFATIGYTNNSSIEIEVIFENAFFKIYDNKLYKYDINSTEATLLCEDQKLEGSKCYYGASHAIAIDTFYNAIINNTNDYISVKDGAYSLKIIEAIVKSSEQKLEVQL